MSFIYMTEESDDPDDPQKLIEHKLPWRSESNKLRDNNNI